MIRMWVFHVLIGALLGGVPAYYLGLWRARGASIRRLFAGKPVNVGLPPGVASRRIKGIEYGNEVHKSIEDYDYRRRNPRWGR